MFDDIYKSTIIWYKKFGGMGDLKAEYGHNYEICIYSTTDRIKFKGERPKAVWDIAVDNSNKYKHPTQKPVALAENAISHHFCNIVLDLFGGSGSTLIACEKTARDCRMMELDPKYCDVIIKRWQDFTGKEATHAETNKNFNESF
jgi:DNA modification methylase